MLEQSHFPAVSGCSLQHDTCSKDFYVPQYVQCRLVPLLMTLYFAVCFFLCVVPAATTPVLRCAAAQRATHSKPSLDGLGGGPGTYNQRLDATKPAAPSYSLGAARSSQFNPFLGYKACVGAYNEDHAAVRRAAPAHSFAHQLTLEDKMNRKGYVQAHDRRQPQRLRGHQAIE